VVEEAYGGESPTRGGERERKIGRGGGPGGFYGTDDGVCELPDSE
jgi:hypothetical protein